MNVKRYVLAAIALFVFMFLYGWLVNGNLLMGLYQRTAQLWRDYPSMKALMPLAILLELVIAFFVTFVFTRFSKHGGAKNGVVFGLFFGLFAALLALSWYIWLPIPGSLAWSWFFAALIEWVVGGLIIGSIYKK